MKIKKDVKKFLIYCNDSISNAMKRLNETAQKNLYVVDENDELVGSLSDGDIRRGILKGIDLENSVSLIMHTNPKVILEMESGHREKIESILLEYHLESIPVIDNDKKVTDIIYWTDIFQKEKSKVCTKKDIPIFILAGGFGTRLEPFTKILPKPLIPIGEYPILERIMDQFNKFGFNKFIISINYKGDMIKAYFADPAIYNKYESIKYIKEEFPMGTIGSLCLAKEDISSTFFITNCDIIVEEDLEKVYNYHKEKQNVLTIVGCIKNSVIPYGVLKTNNKGELIEIEEKPEYNHVINTGVYVAEPEIIEYLSENKRKDITQLIEELLKQNKKIGVYPILDNQWFDIGQWAEYEETRKHFEK
ncbi:MAG: putative signal transduction protein with domain [Deferribacteraceae bacterium]|jgi:dTDP-glucose pyrophosphorylase|nr:putative signal transduction protein with domain [Deferribacteraceae bacterium]